MQPSRVNSGNLGAKVEKNWITYIDEAWRLLKGTMARFQGFTSGNHVDTTSEGANTPGQNAFVPYDWDKILATEDQYIYNNQASINHQILTQLEHPKASKAKILASLLDTNLEHIKHADLFVLCTISIASQLGLANEIVTPQRQEWVQSCIQRARSNRLHLTATRAKDFFKDSDWGDWDVCAQTAVTDYKPSIIVELAKLCRLGISKEDAKLRLKTQIDKRRIGKTPHVQKGPKLQKIDVTNTIIQIKCEIQSEPQHPSKLSMSRKRKRAEELVCAGVGPICEELGIKVKPSPSVNHTVVPKSPTDMNLARPLSDTPLPDHDDTESDIEMGRDRKKSLNNFSSLSPLSDGLGSFKGSCSSARRHSTASSSPPPFSPAFSKSRTRPLHLPLHSRAASEEQSLMEAPQEHHQSPAVIFNKPDNDCAKEESFMERLPEYQNPAIVYENFDKDCAEEISSMEMIPEHQSPAIFPVNFDKDCDEHVSPNFNSSPDASPNLNSSPDASPNLNSSPDATPIRIEPIRTLLSPIEEENSLSLTEFIESNGAVGKEACMPHRSLSVNAQALRDLQNGEKLCASVINAVLCKLVPTADSFLVDSNELAKFDPLSHWNAQQQNNINHLRFLPPRETRRSRARLAVKFIIPFHHLNEHWSLYVVTRKETSYFIEHYDSLKRNGPNAHHGSDKIVLNYLHWLIPEFSMRTDVESKVCLYMPIRAECVKPSSI